MSATRWFPAAALAAALAAAPATAADRSALAQVPATAPLVIHVRGVEGLKDRVVAFLTNALPDVLEKIGPKLDQLVKDGADGRKIAGVPKDGPIFVVFTELPKPGEHPKMAVIAAVSDYQKFRDGLLKEDERKNLKSNGAVERTTVEDRDVFFIDRKGFAVVAASEDVANALAKKADSMDGKMSKTQAARLMESDLGIYLSMDAVNREYGDQIKDARDKIEGGLAQVIESAPKTQRGGLELVRKALGPVFQALEDSQGVLLTFEVRPRALLVHGESELRDGSTTATALKEFTPDDFRDLGRLPPGEMFYSGLTSSAKLLRKLGGVMLGLGGDAEKGTQEVGTALEQLAGAGPGVRIDAAGVPLSGMQLWHFEDPARAVAAQLKLARSLEANGTFQGGVVKDKPTIKEKAQKYGEFTLNSVEVDWDLEKMAEQAAGGQSLPEETRKQIADAMKGILGERLHYWFGTDGKLYLQVVAHDWEAAQKLLDRYFKSDKGVGAQPGFRDVRRDLPERSTFLVIMDPVQYLGVVVEVAKPILSALPIFKIPEGFPAKPNKDQPSYVGLSATLASERGSFDSVVSARSVKEAYRVFVQPFLSPGAR
jgi:hypothetical protein